MIESAAKTRMTHGVWAITGALGLCTCSASVIDVGPGTGGANNGLGGAAGVGGAARDEGTCVNSDPLPEWPSTTACAGTNDLPLVGQWHGYIENQAAPWDELFLDIKGANSTAVCGTLRVGNATPPPPATSPIDAYPPGYDPLIDRSYADWKLIPGYVLTLLDGTSDGTRLRFGISRGEGYKSWCLLQTPYQREDGQCGCIPSGVVTDDTQGQQCSSWDSTSGITRTFTCHQVALCTSPGRYGACGCTPTGCDGLTIADVKFDLIVSGDTIEGSDTAHSGARAHFARLP